MPTSDIADDGLDAMAEALDRANPLRETGSYESDIPLHSIDPAEWNPKTPIWGTYKRGLSTSLGVFGLQDRLKVWPNPKSPGRFITLDGNQRLVVIREKVEDYLASQEATLRLGGELFDEDVAFDATFKDHKKRLDAMFKAVIADESFLAEARQKASSELVPCRVLAGLDLDGAKAFTLSFDRNQARYDETKVRTLADEILSRRSETGSLLDGVRKKHEAMFRPERTYVAPFAPTAPSDNLLAAEHAPHVPTEADPWGPPPPTLEPSAKSEPRAFAGPKPQLVPVMYSFTPEGHAELEVELLKSVGRLIKCKRLTNAIERFNACLPDADLSEAAAEIAMICFQRRIEIAQAHA